jgi:hypothetical protein
MRQGMDERELMRRIADLPREIAPATDPWAAIAARIEQAGKRHSHSGSAPVWIWRAVAATLVVALAAGLLFGPRWDGAPTPPAGPEVATPAAGDFHLPASLAANEAEYQAAFREFIAVGRARPGLSAQTIDRIEAGWADLRETENALTAALEKSPDNDFLAARMMELRARQLGFLQQLAALDQDYRRLTT